MSSSKNSSREEKILKFFALTLSFLRKIVGEKRLTYILTTLYNAIKLFLQDRLDIASKYGQINNRLYCMDDTEKNGLDSFTFHKYFEIPDKLYKFFPNKLDDKTQINYSHQALENNTVFLQSPNLFDDIYDSDIHMDWEEYSNIRLRAYCERCGLNVDETTSFQDMHFSISEIIREAFNAQRDILTIFTVAPRNEMEDKNNQIFSLRVQNELLSGVELQNVVYNVLSREYSEYREFLRNTFRISCFTTSPYSQLMWGGAYADFHKGFCVEYQIDKTSEEYKDILLNLYPVIYCKLRPNITERLAKYQDSNFSKEKLWDIYFHGVLRKSADWAYQDEWRCLLPFDKNSANYNVPFLPISKVFLGNRIAKKDRARIIEICNQKNIPYVGVRRADNVFEMKDFDILCENCPQFINQDDKTPKPV